MPSRSRCSTRSRIPGTVHCQTIRNAQGRRARQYLLLPGKLTKLQVKNGLRALARLPLPVPRSLMALMGAKAAATPCRAPHERITQSRTCGTLSADLYELR